MKISIEILGTLLLVSEVRHLHKYCYWVQIWSWHFTWIPVLGDFLLFQFVWKLEISPNHRLSHQKSLTTWHRAKHLKPSDSFYPHSFILYFFCHTFLLYFILFPPSVFPTLHLYFLILLLSIFPPFFSSYFSTSFIAFFIPFLTLSFLSSSLIFAFVSFFHPSLYFFHSFNSILTTFRLSFLCAVIICLFLNVSFLPSLFHSFTHSTNVKPKYPKFGFFFLPSIVVTFYFYFNDLSASSFIGLQ